MVFVFHKNVRCSKPEWILLYFQHFCKNFPFLLGLDEQPADVMHILAGRKGVAPNSSLATARLPSSTSLTTEQLTVVAGPPGRTGRQIPAGNGPNYFKHGSFSKALSCESD